jgi:hypothetical protein
VNGIKYITYQKLAQVANGTRHQYYSEIFLPPGRGDVSGTCLSEASSSSPSSFYPLVDKRADKMLPNLSVWHTHHQQDVVSPVILPRSPRRWTSAPWQLPVCRENDDMHGTVQRGNKSGHVRRRTASHTCIERRTLQAVWMELDRIRLFFSASSQRSA